MSYREKIAWLSLIAMAVAYGPYFMFVARDPAPGKPLPHLHPLGLFALVSIVRMLSGALAICISASAPPGRSARHWTNGIAQSSTARSVPLTMCLSPV